MFVGGVVAMKEEKYFCYGPDLEEIKKMKKDFIQRLIWLNVKYNVCGLISSHMNQAIKLIEDDNQ